MFLLIDRMSNVTETYQKNIQTTCTSVHSNILMHMSNSCVFVFNGNVLTAGLITAAAEPAWGCGAFILTKN